MEVKGWCVRLCENCENDRNCDKSSCPNKKDTKYYVKKEHFAVLAKRCLNKPLVINHLNHLVVGKILHASYKEGEGIYVHASIDDEHFLACLDRSYRQYNQKKPEINKLAWTKNLYSSFSLSSRDDLFDHISLVSTPGRQGTLICYFETDHKPTKYRPENQNIGDYVLGYMSVFISESDRKNYLIDSNKTSLFPNDVQFLQADRTPVAEKMSYTLDQIRSIVDMAVSQDRGKRQATESIDDYAAASKMPKLEPPSTLQQQPILPPPQTIPILPPPNVQQQQLSPSTNLPPLQQQPILPPPQHQQQPIPQTTTILPPPNVQQKQLAPLANLLPPPSTTNLQVLPLPAAAPTAVIPEQPSTQSGLTAAQMTDLTNNLMKGEYFGGINEKVNTMSNSMQMLINHLTNRPADQQLPAQQQQHDYRHRNYNEQRQKLPMIEASRVPVSSGSSHFDNYEREQALFREIARRVVGDPTNTQ